MMRDTTIERVRLARADRRKEFPYLESTSGHYSMVVVDQMAELWESDIVPQH